MVEECEAGLKSPRGESSRPEWESFDVTSEIPHKYAENWQFSSNIVTMWGDIKPSSGEGGTSRSTATGRSPVTKPSLARFQRESTEKRKTRPCRSRRGTGEVVEDVEYSAPTGQLLQAMTDCPICGGDGRVNRYASGR